MARFDPQAYRAQRAKEYETQGINTPTAPVPTSPVGAQAVFAPWQKEGFLTADGQEKEKQTFMRKVGEDALTLGLTPSALAAEIPNAVAHPGKFLKNTAIGFADSVVSMFDKEEWKAHPLLNAVNTVANVTIVGGLLKSAALGSARNAALTAAREAAIKAGADSILVEAAFKGARPMKAAVFEAARTGSAAPVSTATRAYLQRAGVAPELATSIAEKVSAETVGKFLTENKAQLNLMDVAAHPVQAFGKTSFVSRPIQELIFGTPEKSAVGKLYGSEVVARDVRGFGQLEEWAGLQAAERGIKDTVDNRVRVMEDWVSNNPEYAALSPEQRVKHFQEYAKADLIRHKFSSVHNREYILTKALPQHYVAAMKDFVSTISGKVTNGQVIDDLIDKYGKDFSLHVEEVRAKMKGLTESDNRAPLLEALDNLANNNIPISVGRLSKAEKTFLAQLEGSGYRVGRAPKSKEISQPVSVKGDVFDKAALVAERTTIGRIVDKLGLSPAGVVEGTQFFAFREAFTQELLKKFGSGKTIEINKVKYPVESLSFQLEKLRELYMRNRSGVLPPIHTIADLRKNDLVKLGFDEKTATALDKIIRESNVTSPTITGIGEALSNYLRTRDNPLSRGYNNFLRLQSDLRFKKNPMFGIQAAVESHVWGNMWAKTPPGATTLNKAMKAVMGLKAPIIQSGKEVTMREQAMVLEEVMLDYNRQLRDAGMSPEIYRGISELPNLEKTGIPGVGERLSFTAKNADSNIWLGMAGFSNTKVATNLMRSYAKRFGMELDEALSYKMVGGKKVYDNPWMVENMRSAAQSIFGYKAGVLTSPMIRTLNTIFFPIRFQTKSLMQTAEWLGSLSPMSRMFVMNQFTTMADFLTTEEGKKWREKNRPVMASLFNYAFAFEGIGKSVDAATRGSLFGGNTGLIGGLPFGFLFNIARDLGYVGEDPSFNPNTGKQFKREVVKDEASFAAFVTVVEDIIASLVPAMPFYTATAGQVTFSPSREVRTFTEQVLSALAGGLDPNKDPDDYRREIRKGKKKVQPEYRKKLPNPIDLILPGKAEAAELPIATANTTPKITSPRGFFSRKELSYKREESPAPAPKPAHIVAGVDISSYATDPEHEVKINRIYESIPETFDAVELDEYIKARAATSSVRGGMVKRAAEKHGISPRLLLAIMQQDSGFGTRGKGARTRNPGNFGNDDTGRLIHFKTWEDGVMAVAEWLAEHKAE